MYIIGYYRGYIENSVPVVPLVPLGKNKKANLAVHGSKI
jgi:hypothetical protein